MELLDNFSIITCLETGPYDGTIIVNSYDNVGNVAMGVQIYDQHNGHADIELSEETAQELYEKLGEVLD